MRDLIVGDIHLSANPRDEYRHTFQKWLRNTAKTLKPDRIVLMGDLTEEKDRHPAVLVNRVVDHVYRLAKIAPVIALCGNHDYREEGKAFFEFLRRIPNTVFIGEPRVIADALFLPHTNNYKRDWQHIDLGATDVCFAHQTFADADLGHGHRGEGIPIKIFPKSQRVFCGDVHIPQQKGPIIYTGAPYRIDFGDEYDSSVILRADDRWDRIDTAQLPQKRAITLTTGDVDLRNQFFNVGDIAQITVDVDDMGGWLPLRENIRKDAEDRGLRIWTIKPKLIARAVRRQHRVTNKGSARELLVTFSKRQGLDERTIIAGQKLL